MTGDNATKSGNDNEDSNKRKREGNSNAGTSQQHKKYLLDSATLMQNNRYYLPQNIQELITEPVSDQSEKTSKIKIPPIYLHEANNYQAVIDDIKNIVEGEFSTQSKTDSIRINLTTPTDFRNLTKFYDDGGMKYHTYRNPERSIFTVVIKNIPISISEIEVLESLQDKFPVKKVVRLLNRYKNPTQICVVDLENTEEAKQIYSLSRLMHSVVSVEPRKKPTDIPQCARCQRFGHTKNYCKLTPRCVKCQENHLYSECTRRKTDKPICVNCGAEHPANYRGCTYYKQIKSRISKNQETKQNPVVNNNTQNHFKNYNPASSNNISPRSTPYQSYANVTSGNIPNNKQTQNQNNIESSSPFIDTILSLILDLIRPHMDQIKRFISNLIPILFSNVGI